MSKPFQHVPVMGDVIVEVFGVVPAGWLVDATLGAGGHARLLLDARPDCRLLGLDQDPDAVRTAAAVLAGYGERVVIRHARFDALATIMDELRMSAVSGVLFDLGVSSPQFDRPERGFSYRHDGPLDMRMDTTATWSAADVVNGYSDSELSRILREHGGERYADRIARAIVSRRPIESTAELATVVRDAIPAPARRGRGHPARRTFQAIRIEVNKELDVLPGAIDAAIAATSPGGRVAVLSYHSGEDRIVKERFRHAATGGCSCPSGLPCVCDAVRTVRLLRPAAQKPAHAEVANNRRAESARLRVAERLPDDDRRAAER